VRRSGAEREAASSGWSGASAIRAAALGLRFFIEIDHLPERLGDADP
jgi:hypothetical protein